MPAIIRHWISASPVMFAGMVTAAVTSPPRLVTKPWAPASRTWFSITSWTARSDVAALLLELLVGGLGRRRERADAVDGAVEGLAHEGRGQPRRHARDPRSELLAHRALHTHGCQPTGAAEAPTVLPCAPSRRRASGRSRGPDASTPTTTWSRPAPTSRRAPCWRRTGAGSSRCPRAGAGDPMMWFSPVRRGVLPLDRLRVSRSLRRSLRRFEVRVERRLRPGHRRLRRSAPARRLDRPVDPGGVRRAAPPRLGALGRGLARRPAGRRAVRRLDRRAVRRRVDVPPGDRRVEGRARGPRRPARATCPGEPRLLDVQWRTPHLASLGCVEISRREYLDRLPEALAATVPAAFA